MELVKFIYGFSNLGLPLPGWYRALLEIKMDSDRCLGVIGMESNMGGSYIPTPLVGNPDGASSAGSGSGGSCWLKGGCRLWLKYSAYLQNKSECRDMPRPLVYPLQKIVLST